MPKRHTAVRLASSIFTASGRTTVPKRHTAMRLASSIFASIRSHGRAKKAHGRATRPTVNPLPCLIGELSFKILNVNEISQSNYDFLNLFKTYQNIQLKS